MISFPGKLSERFKQWPMQKKLTYSYSFTIITICILINLIFYPVFSRHYEKQLRFSVNQSCSQAINFISNYIENMYYISELIANNPNINEVLSSNDFSQERELDEQFREFWNLIDGLRIIELSNTTYKMGLYIPDRLIYSNNNYYIYPESALMMRSDYKTLYQTISMGKGYFSLMKESIPYNPELKKEYIALLKMFKVRYETNEERAFISKVGITISELQKVLDNAISIHNGLVYLFNDRNELVAHSHDEDSDTISDFVLSMERELTPWSQVTLGNNNYYILKLTIENIGWQMFSLIPVREYKRQIQFIRIILLLIVLLISISVAGISYKLSRYYSKRLTLLNHKMKDLQKGDFDTGFSAGSPHSGDEIDEIYNNFNYMTEEIKRLLDEHYKLGKEIVSAELKALQAQINPHFLYNTLDLINWVAMDYKAKEISYIAQNLGKFYRLSLNGGKTIISIEDELSHVESYVKIENAHFDGALKLQIDVSEEIKKCFCLNIILQPFVENSIIHGIAEHPDIKECHIHILAAIENDDIIFQVKDDGKGIDQEKLLEIMKELNQNSRGGYGIKNVNFRLRLYYGEQYGVRITSVQNEGTCVFIRIPAVHSPKEDDSC